MHVDWADPFFDLFYVGAAYQVGTMLKYDVSMSGAYYFFTIASALLDSWAQKTMHSSQFGAHDVFHKAVDAIYACTVAFACVHVQPREEMQADYGHKQGLATALLLNTLILAGQKLEIYHMTDREDAKFQALLNLSIEVCPHVAMYMIALVLAYVGAGWFTMSIFIFGGWFFGTLMPFLLYMVKVLPMNTIPFHYQQITHRYGELIMLMLGESILSVIVQKPIINWRYYVAMATGLVIVQQLQLAHFSSAEFDPHKHALGRKLRAGRVWLFFMSLYSISLIAFGVGLKATLGYSARWSACESPSGSSAASSSPSSSGSHRLAADHGTASDGPGAAVATAAADYVLGQVARRLGGGAADYPTGCGEYQPKPVPHEYVWLVCSAVFVQYIALQLTVPLHEGVQIYMHGLFRGSTRVATVLIVFKVLSVVFAMCIPAICMATSTVSTTLLLSMLLFLTTVQGLLQAVENMLVSYHRQQDSEIDLAVQAKKRQSVHYKRNSFKRLKSVFVRADSSSTPGLQLASLHRASHERDDELG